MNTTVSSARQEPLRVTLVERWLPLAFWLGIIYMFSTDTFSASETSGFFSPVLRFLIPGISIEGVEFWHAVFRKAGHVTEYFALSVLAFRAFCGALPDFMSTSNATMAFTFAIASGDEFHQLFTASRTGSFVDVGYDCSGAVAALWLLTRLELRRSVR